MVTYPEYKIEWYEKISSPGAEPEWEAVPVEIDIVTSITVSEALSDSSSSSQDSFTIDFPNNDSDGNGYGDLTYEVDTDDLIVISFRNDGGAWQQVMSGKATDSTQEIKPSSRTMSVKGVNRMQALLRSKFALDIKNDKPPMMIVQILAEVNEFNITSGTPNKITYVYYNEDTAQYEDQDGNVEVAGNVTIQRNMNDGSAFAELDSFNSWYDDAYTQIQKLSGNDMTDDGNYLFYVDNDNNFYWVGKTTAIDATLTEGTDFTGAKVSLNTNDVVNFYIVHCGTSPSGYGMITFASNDESIAAHGLRGEFYDLTYFGEQVMKIEFETNGASFDSDFPTGTSGYYPTAAALAAGYVMSFTPRISYVVGGVNYDPGDTITVSSKADYNEAIVKECKARGESEAGPVLDALGEGRWECQIDKLGTTAYSKGNMIELEIFSQNWTGADTKVLRLTEISHSFTSRGWYTTLYLKEDEESL